VCVFTCKPLQENLLGQTGYAKVPYESLCQRGTAPNEDVFAARNARMWQVDENDGNEYLNMAVIKRVSGEDSISCRALYGHVVEIPPRAKLNFGVNKPPKLPPAKDLVEQFALLRRFVYIDCAMNFLDLTPESKDTARVEELRARLAPADFTLCVRQVDVNLDDKLRRMRSGFLRLFAAAIHSRFEAGVFMGLEIPQCIQQQSLRMMQCNAGFDAVEFLSGTYEGGVSGEILVRDMYQRFLREMNLREDNYRASRFDEVFSRFRICCCICFCFIFLCCICFCVLMCVCVCVWDVCACVCVCVPFCFTRVCARRT
jgi:hypothetical protein